MYLERFFMKLKFPVERGKSSCEKNFVTFVQVLNLLDVFIILYQNGWLETERN